VTRKKGKRTPAQKAEKRRKSAMYETLFLNGKQKRVRRSQPDNEIDGCPIDDPIYLKQHEMWSELHEWDMRQDQDVSANNCGSQDDNRELPF